MSSSEASLRARILTQLLAVVVFVGLPGLLTAVAPVAYITLQREGTHVTARAQTCLLFIIPYKTASVDPVTHLRTRTAAGSITWERRRGTTDHYHQADTQGILAIEGPGQTAEVWVSPHDLGTVLGKAEAFLADPQATELKLFVVSNWKFGVIAGGLISLLTLLYAVGVAAAIGQALLRLLGLGRKARPKPEALIP